MDCYAKLYREYFALDGYVGRKSKMEMFAGADETLTFEAMMPSGKALQSCTSHDLGHNFAEVFDTKFQDEDGEYKYVWQTSWGLSTRSIGGLIVGHGDDNGLVLPPRLAPKQVVIVPVKADKSLIDYANELKATLNKAGIRASVDNRDDERFGFKLNKWEIKGVPVIFKIGDKEVDGQSVTAKRRDTGDELQFKAMVAVDETTKLLETIQDDLLVKSRKTRDENTREAATYEEMKQTLEKHKGFVKVFWNDNSDIEAKIKEETKAVSRCCIATNQKGLDFYTGEPASEVWLFAQSY